VFIVLWLVKRWQSFNVLSIVLWPLSIVYCTVMVLRRLAYQTGTLSSFSVGLPVIVVGNITVGGTGKTPLVIWLATWLTERGHRPGIILRGYRGRSKSWPRRVLPETSAEEVGDEAVLLSRRTGCPVVAAPDRVAAARELEAHTDCTIIISDDGLQHYRLKRDYEIAVVDSERGYGNGLCLPSGPLREPTSRAKAVNLMITNGNAISGKLSMEIVPSYFRNIANDSRSPLDEFKGKSVHAIAGIGNPDRFFNTLKEIGVLATHHPFPDHYNFSANDMDFGDDRDIIMTEKDAVKCAGFVGANGWALEVNAEPVPGAIEKLQNWVEEIPVG